MSGDGREGRARIATVLGVSVAVGALLVLAMLPAATSAVRLVRPAVLAAADPTCFTGDTPRDPGYDPVTHEMYVPNEGYPGEPNGAPNISVFSGTCHLVGTISLSTGAVPIQAAFDPMNNDMYVTDAGLNQVYVISGTKILDTITGFDEPMGITFDEYQPGMVVVNSGADLVDLVVGTAYTPLFFTGSDPYEILFDPSCVCDLVTNTGSDNVTIYREYVPVFTDSEPVGKSPRGIAYDPLTGFEYVANSGSNNISILDAGTLQPFIISGLDGPYGVAWDQSTLTIWVTNDGNGKVFEIGGSGGVSIVKKLSTASGSHALGLAYDEFNDDMYVTGFDTNVVYVL